MSAIRQIIIIARIQYLPRIRYRAEQLGFSIFPTAIAFGDIRKEANIKQVKQSIGESERSFPIPISIIKEKSSQRDWRINISITKFERLYLSIFYLLQISCYNICVFGIVGYKVIIYTDNSLSYYFLKETVAPALSIGTQIANLIAKMPNNPIGLALNATSGRFVNKDVAAYDQLVALVIIQLTEAVRQGAINIIFNNGDRVLSVVNTVLTGKNIRWPFIIYIDSDLRLAFGAGAYGTQGKGKASALTSQNNRPFVTER